MGGDLVLLFGASLLGSAHCVAMCGPYVAMCTAQFVPRGASPGARCGLRVLFNLGRIATYSLIGLIVGAFGQIAEAVASRFGVAGIVAIAAGSAALAFGLSMIGWFRDPASVIAMAGVGRWLIAGRMRLNQAAPAAAPPPPGSFARLASVCPGVRSGESSVAGRDPRHGRVHHAGVWAGNGACGVCVDGDSADAAETRKGATAGGRAVGRSGSALDIAGSRELWISTFDGMVVMSATHAGLMRGFASRQCAHCP